MASRLFTVDLDLGLNKAKRFIFEDFSTNPNTDLTTGRIIYFTGAGSDQNHLRLYNGTAWKTVAFTDNLVEYGRCSQGGRVLREGKAAC
jgi:hypothetical protein